MAGEWRRIAIDSTGLGIPVLEQARERLRPSPYGISITSGASPNVDGQDWRVPKADLVGALQVALQNRRLRIARSLPERGVWVNEMKAFRATMTASGTTYGNDPSKSQHDDLVVATMLATYLAKRCEGGAQSYFESLSWTCEACGLPTSNQLQNCVSCGAARPPLIDPEEPLPPEPQPWVCSNCLSRGIHTENPGTRDRCRCGWRVRDAPEPTNTIDAQTHVPPVRRPAFPHPRDPRTWWPG